MGSLQLPDTVHIASCHLVRAEHLRSVYHYLQFPQKAVLSHSFTVCSMDTNLGVCSLCGDTRERQFLLEAELLFKCVCFPLLF